MRGAALTVLVRAVLFVFILCVALIGLDLLTK